MQLSGFTIQSLATVDSTNNYAARPEIQSKLQHKTVIMSEHQTSGKGQMGNKWESEDGKNLLISIYLEHKLPVKNQFLLNCATALSINDTISYFLPETAKIKWPNDIIINDLKIAGILIENAIAGQFINRSIVGIGININQTKFSSGNYNSFKFIGGKEFDLNRILEYLLYRFNDYYQQINLPDSQLHTLFNSYLYRKNVWHVFKTPDMKKVEGEILGTTVEGKLEILFRNGIKKSFNHREIFFT